MVSRKITIDELAFSIEEIDALQMIAGVSCDGIICTDCPFYIKGLDNCVVDLARQTLNIQDIPYVKHENEEA